MLTSAHGERREKFKNAFFLEEKVFVEVQRLNATCKHPHVSLHSTMAQRKTYRKVIRLLNPADTTVLLLLSLLLTEGLAVGSLGITAGISPV